MVTTGLAMSLTFSGPYASPLPLILVGLLVVVFLLLESRRYRYFSVWRARCRLMETDVYGPMLRGEGVTLDGKWNMLLAERLRAAALPRQLLAGDRAAAALELCLYPGDPGDRLLRQARDPPGAGRRAGDLRRAGRGRAAARDCWWCSAGWRSTGRGSLLAIVTLSEREARPGRWRGRSRCLSGPAPARAGRGAAAVSGVGSGLVVGGAADVVEELLDVELGGGFGLGLELLDGLAGGLQLGFVGAAGDVDGDRGVDLGVEGDADRVEAELLDRLVEDDLAAVEARSRRRWRRRRCRGW